MSEQIQTANTPRGHYVPGVGYRIVRRVVQIAAIAGLCLAPLLGGWQRLDEAEMAMWDDGGWNLPTAVLDRLPAGDASARAHERNALMGGGVAADVAGIPFVDPLSGALALLRSSLDGRSLLALALPVILGLLAGRVFCGWLCPFGILSRALDALTVRISSLPRFALPPGRPIRWAVLLCGVAASMLGVHLVLYLSLPYLLLQQSIYGLWLLGGGGVVLSVLLGLLAAGLLFGPTVYCAAICPTGATLSFLGRARVVRLHVAESARCGQSCHLCETACWLQLDPRSGDPGPDCDLCGRCVPACPQAQLGIGVSPPRLTTMRSLALLVALGGSTLWPDAALAGEVKPRLVLEQERRFEDVTVAVSLVDLSGVKLNFDWAQAQSGTDLSVYIVRGELARPDEHGLIPQRETYAGPLRVALHLGDGGAARSVEFAVPNHPISTHAPVIYRAHLDARFAPGDRIVVLPIPGFLADPVAFTVPHVGARGTIREHAVAFFASFLVCSGVLSLALGLRRDRRARPPAVLLAPPASRATPVSGEAASARTRPPGPRG